MNGRVIAIFCSRVGGGAARAGILILLSSRQHLDGVCPPLSMMVPGQAATLDTRHRDHALHWPMLTRTGHLLSNIGSGDDAMGRILVTTGHKCNPAFSIKSIFAVWCQK